MNEERDSKEELEKVYSEAEEVIEMMAQTGLTMKEYALAVTELLLEQEHEQALDEMTPKAYLPKGSWEHEELIRVFRNEGYNTKKVPEYDPDDPTIFFNSGDPDYFIVDVSNYLRYLSDEYPLEVVNV